MSSSKAIVRQRLRAALKELERGRPAAARPLLEQALVLDRGNAEATGYLGVALLQGGDPGRAVALLDQAARAMPEVPWVHAHLGEACSRVGDSTRALEAYDRARTLQPGDPAYATGAASALAAQGRHDEAAEIFEELLRRAPGDARAWYNLGTLRRDQGRVDDAVRCFSVAVDTQPDWVDARNSLGSALHALFRFEAAERAYRDCIEARSDEPAFQLNLVSLLIDVGRFEEAEKICRAVVVRWPRLGIAHSLLGVALTHQGKLLQALEHEALAVDIEPGSSDFVESHAFGLAFVGRLDEAWTAFGGVQSVDFAAKTSSHAKRSLLLLGSGRLSEGWEGYEHRPSSIPSMSVARRRRSLPEPSVLRAGASVRLVNEQGLGDELFFLRYAQLITGLGGHVVYHASARLGPFLRHCAELLAVFDKREAAGADQEFMLIGDLPSALHRADLLVGPAASEALVSSDRDTRGYPPPLRLRPCADRIRTVTTRLRECGPAPYIALTWRGGVLPKRQGNQWTLYKAVPLQQLADALRNVPGTLISIQFRPEETETRMLGNALGRTLHDLSALNESLEDMLALLACVDEYICVSNTNTHIRAGTGRSARVLVPGPAEWRWPLGQSTSPWFPGFKVYHQDLSGDWTDALAALRRDLVSRA